MEENYLSFKLVSLMMHIGLSEDDDTHMMYYHTQYMEEPAMAASSVVGDVCDYNDGVDIWPAPTYEQARTWFMDTHRMYITVDYIKIENCPPWVPKVINLENGTVWSTNKSCDSYTEAMECGIYHAIGIILYKE